MGLRIIGGELRGRRLAAPGGRHTRPSAARLREAVFNILRERVPDSAVLDLFAGSGALGIEALSRGACHAVFIDNRKEALAALRRNIDGCRVQERSRIYRCDIRRNLACLASHREAFDLVFMDPPYGRALIAPTLDHLIACGRLMPAALVIVEHEAGESVPPAGTVFECVDRRSYGKSLVSFLRFMV